MAITLKGKAREAAENVKKLREGGEIPAVVYGAGRETVSISVSLRDFTKVSKAAGESGAVALDIDGKNVTVLIHEVGVDPVTSTPIHVDFLAIDVTKPLEVSLPLTFVGVSPAVKGSLGTLVKSMHELEVRGLSKDLPHEIEVDISTLDVVDSHISVADLKLPNGVVALAKPADLVVGIASVKEEVEEAPTAIDFASIEVEKKGKKEEEGEAETK
jgi:large subunit ribosomal protein L25